MAGPTAATPTLGSVRAALAAVLAFGSVVLVVVVAAPGTGIGDVSDA